MQKHIHIIGICGVLSSAIASAFHEIGWKVTGSDKGFYPPVSTHLTSLGINFYAGWHPEKMIADGSPDLVVVATASGSKNPEMLYANDHHIRVMSYTDVIKEYFVGKNSIVCAGTWGKTTITTLLSFILERAQYQPSYMFGGISLSQKLSARISPDVKKTWSVLEGDEYKSGPQDPTAKFFYYNPTHLLLTGIEWDHADLYPTETSYLAVFDKLLKEVAERNMAANKSREALSKHFVICGDNEKLSLLVKQAALPHCTYGRSSDCNYRYEAVSESKLGIQFDIIHAAKKYPIKSPMLGEYNAENITGCFAMAHSIGINPEVIQAAIGDFAGIKRRLEKRYVGDITIIDTHAPTPDKAQAGLSVLRKIYKNKIVAIFEPNIGGRQRESAYKYNGAFRDADLVLIPRFTKLKVDSAATEQPMEAEEVASIISKNHPNVIYLGDDKKLVEMALSTTKKDDVIVFLGSHGFRGMIEESISLHQQSQ